MKTIKKYFVKKFRTITSENRLLNKGMSSNKKRVRANDFKSFT